LLVFSILLVCSAASGNVVPTRDQLVYEILPSVADASITRFNDPNYVVFGKNPTSQQSLVVFLPGTLGKPRNAARLLGVVADQGYLAIGLSYNDSPGIVQVCPRNPSLTCSAAVREKRIFGDDVTSVVSNTPAESIVHRLVTLLEYLDSHDPERQWKSYLLNNEPNWSRIVVSGLSQGAGMAAYIAKRKRVARVVLFSSPWDFHGPAKILASWLAEPSATPPELWFAEYHRREKTMPLIAAAYQKLRIPPENIRVLDLDLPAGGSHGANPYHVSTISNPAYRDDWIFLFGHSL
jgi:hypothetical protein